MEIIKLPVGDLAVNCYIIKNNGEAFVIDPGDNYEKIKQTAGVPIKYVLLTHGHFDHIGAVDALKKDGAKVYISKEDEPMLSDGALNVSAYFGYSFTPSSADGLFGDTLDICGLNIKIIKTPGHTMGGVCFLIGDKLFSGDTLFFESVGRCDFPGSDGLMLISKIKNELFTLPEATVVYPGHGGNTSIDHEKRFNMYVR